MCFNDNRAIEPRFCYLALVEVESLEDISTDMVGKTLPANTYAMFTHRGSLAKLGLTYQYIYGKWLSSSDYVLAGEYDFECYDQRSQGIDTEFDIYVPVEAKQAQEETSSRCHGAAALGLAPRYILHRLQNVGPRP